MPMKFLEAKTSKTPPNADEILSQFKRPSVYVCRCVLLTALKFIKWIRRVKWESKNSASLDIINTPVLFASNHQSHIDTHVILDVLPKKIRDRTAVAAAFDHFADATGTSIKKRLIQFMVASIWHAFGIERIKSPLSSIRTMQSLLERNWSIVIYPEGTRSRTGKIGSFKGGLAILAKKSGRPVVPVCVEGGLNVLPEATYIPKPGKVLVSFGKPVHFQEDDSSKTFMERVERSVCEMATQQ